MKIKSNMALLLLQQRAYLTGKNISCLNKNKFLTIDKFITNI